MALDVREETVEFFNGTTRLTGTLSLPTSGFGHPALIALHAANEGKASFALYQHLAQVLPDHGVAVLLYDRRGSGNSGGGFSAASFDTLVEDADAGVKLLRSHPEIDPQRVGAWGVSQGGWLAPMLAGHSRLKALVLVSGSGVSPERQMDYSAEFALRAAGFTDDVVSHALRLRHSVNAYYRGERPRPGVQDEVDRAAHEPWFEHAFVGHMLPDEVANSKWALELSHDPKPVMAAVGVPTLLIYSESDPWIPVEESIAAWRASTPDWVEVVRLHGADHLMMSAPAGADGSNTVSKRYQAALVRWLTSHL